MIRSESDNVLTRTKWVRVMADYFSNGIWEKDGSMADLNDLPVNADAIFMLGAWQQWHDSRKSDEEIPQLDRFVSYGLSIARYLKKQLPDWTIVYHDENRHADFVVMSLRIRRS